MYIYIYIRVYVFIYLYMYIYAVANKSLLTTIYLSRLQISGKALSTVADRRSIVFVLEETLFLTFLSYTQVVTILTAPSRKTLHIHLLLSFVRRILLCSRFFFLPLFLSLSCSPEEYLRSFILFTMQKCKVYLQNMCVLLLVNICVLFRFRLICI